MIKNKQKNNKEQQPPLCIRPGLTAVLQFTVVFMEIIHARKTNATPLNNYIFTLIHFIL